MDYWIKKLTKLKSGFNKIAAPLILILKTTMLSQVLVANEIFVANEVGGIEGGDELIEKYGKLSKIRKLSKLRNSKSKTLSKFKKHLALEYVFILLRLVFTNIRIKRNDFLRY